MSIQNINNNNAPRILYNSDHDDHAPLFQDQNISTSKQPEYKINQHDQVIKNKLPENKLLNYALQESSVDNTKIQASKQPTYGQNNVQPQYSTNKKNYVNKISNSNQIKKNQNQEANQNIAQRSNTTHLRQNQKQGEYNSYSQQDNNIFNTAGNQGDLTAFEIANNNKSLSALLELDENYLDGPNAKGVKKKLANGLAAPQNLLTHQQFYNSYYGQSNFNKKPHINQAYQSSGNVQQSHSQGLFSNTVTNGFQTTSSNNLSSLNQLGKLQLKRLVIGEADIQKDKQNLDKFMTHYSNNTTIAAKSRNNNQDGGSYLNQNNSFDNRLMLNTSSNAELQQMQNQNFSGHDEYKFQEPNQANHHTIYQNTQKANSNLMTSAHQTLSTLMHPQITITNQNLAKSNNNHTNLLNNLKQKSFIQDQSPQNQGVMIDKTNQQYQNNSNQQDIYQLNYRAKSQNNTITSRGEKFIGRNGKMLKSAYQTSNEFNQIRYKNNRSQLATTGHPSNRPNNQILNSYIIQSQKQSKSVNKNSNSNSNSRHVNRLRFLMEENVIFQEESDAKIDYVISNALRENILDESKEYHKLLKIVEDMDSKFLGDQTKFEMRFNLDLVFGGYKDIQKFVNEDQNQDEINSRDTASVQKSLKSLERLRKSESLQSRDQQIVQQSTLDVNAINSPLNDYQNNYKKSDQLQYTLSNQIILTNQQPQSQFLKNQHSETLINSQDNMILIIDLIDKLLKSKRILQQANQKFDQDEIDEQFSQFNYHTYEVQKLFRVLFRQINNPCLNQIIQSISIWMILWIDQINKYCELRVDKIIDQSKDKSDILTLQFEKRWKDLEEHVKQELVVKDQELDKLKLSLERLIRDKERVEDTLRHRDSEIQMLNRNPDYDQLKGMLDELANYLDECDERTLELNPQIESIRNISQLVHQLEDQKKIDDLKKSKEPKIIKVRKRKQTERSVEQQITDLQKQQSIQASQPVIQEKVVVRIQKVYERIPTADQPHMAQLINPSESPQKPMTSHNDLRNNRQREEKNNNFICCKCGRSESESKQLLKLQREREKQALKQMQQNQSQIKESQTQMSPIKEKFQNSSKFFKDMITQTQLTLIKEPYSSIADQMLGQTNNRRGTFVNNRKVLIMPKDTLDNQAKQSNQSLSRNIGIQNQVSSSTQSTILNQKLGDPAILKLVETAMEEMVRFEMNEQSQYFSIQQQQHSQIASVKKIFEFKEYLFDYLLTQYGLRNIAQKNYDQIIQVSYKIIIIPSQRIYWFAERDNQYAQQMLNALGNNYPSNNRVWSINKQHVCIFAKIVYTDSLNLMKQSSMRGDISPARRMSRIDLNLVGDAFNSGGSANIFDLIELMSKYASSSGSSDNPMTIKLLQNIKPGPLLDEDVTSIDSEFENESIFFELAQMKITAKLAKFGFDHKYFLDTIDYKDKGKIKFDKVISQLMDRFNIHFSQAEVIALRRYFLQLNGRLSPTQITNNTAQNNQNQQQVPLQLPPSALKSFKISIRDTSARSLQSLLLSQQEFMSKIRLYFISKAQFIQFVLEEYDYYMEQLSGEIQVLFKKYDDFYQRGGINQQQFANLIRDDLNLTGGGGIGLMQSLEDEKQIEKLFRDALEFLEENEYLKSEKLLGLGAVKEIIMERNLESLPFYTYMRNKFNSGKQMSTNKKQKQMFIQQQQQNNISSSQNGGVMSIGVAVGSEDESPLNRSASPMRRGTLRLKRI